MLVFRAPWRAFTLCWLLAILSAAQGATAETLQFGVEWRLLRAAEVRLSFSHPSSAELTVRSVGLLNNLYKLNNIYQAAFAPGYCALNTHLEAHEGRRRRDTTVVFNRETKVASYLERDLVKDSVVLAKEFDVPACVHEATGGLQKLRESRLEPGKTLEVPFSDGKKVVMAKVEAIAREKVVTPSGEFQCVKYEAFLFNGAVYSRKGRMFLWISEDERRLPVQIKLQFPFYVGTITMQLEKTK